MIMKTILSIFTKNKLIFIMIALGAAFWFMTGKLTELSTDNKRLASNLVTVVNNFDRQYKTDSLKNGKLIRSINALTVEANEFKMINSELNERIEDLGLKVKNLSSATDIGFNYTFAVDSLKSVLTNIIINDTIPNRSYNKYRFDKIDDYIDLQGDIVTFDNDSLAPQITDLKVKLSDSLLILPEIKYKRSWIFWKKAIGVELKINNTNPYYNVDYMKHYEFKK